MTIENRHLHVGLANCSKSLRPGDYVGVLVAERFEVSVNGIG